MRKEQFIKVRKQMGVSQFLVAKLSGVSRYRISLWECGYAQLSNRELEKIMKVLTKLANKEPSL